MFQNFWEVFSKTYVQLLLYTDCFRLFNVVLEKKFTSKHEIVFSESGFKVLHLDWKIIGQSPTGEWLGLGVQLLCETPVDSRVETSLTSSDQSWLSEAVTSKVVQNWPWSSYMNVVNGNSQKKNSKNTSQRHKIVVWLFFKLSKIYYGNSIQNFTSRQTQVRSQQ